MSKYLKIRILTKQIKVHMVMFFSRIFWIACRQFFSQSCLFQSNSQLIYSFLQMITMLGKTSIQKTFSFGHCPNHLSPPLTPIRATWSFFLGKGGRYINNLKNSWKFKMNSQLNSCIYCIAIQRYIFF